MKYIKKPIIIIPIIILLFLGGIVIWFEDYPFGMILIIISVILMIISFIEALISKKWLKGFLYFVFYGVLLFSPLLFMVTVLAVGTNSTTTMTTEYYNERLNYHLEPNELIELAILCKDDEVYESFTGDLNATCIFKLSNTGYKKLISKIENNKNFEKLNIKDFQNQIDLNELECSKNIIFKKNGYQSVNDSGMYARIVISSDNKYCLFNIDYY